ncbi:sensor histidine kinase [Pontibacter ruber]|uniref:Sensor histidine kinase n=1 Tax=Pontibacter ruber TaxID=1343895 RepID=A0ABW5CTR7_9BACT|nr:histidine kinase [Pontibacter ruber]
MPQIKTEIFTPTGAGKRNWYILYWAGYVLLFSLAQGFAARDISTAFYNELFSLLPKVVFVLLVMEWLMEAMFFKNKIGSFLLIYTCFLLLFAFIQRLIDNHIIISYFLTNWTKEPLLSTAPYLYNVIKLQFVVTVPFSIKLFYYWAKEKNKAQTIEAEKMQAELHSLRNQFHPHFMFNVLNSLYSRILAKSDDAGDMLLQISSLLRFSVYEANDKIISLEKEIRYISNYIALQQMRFDHRLELSFTVAGEVENRMIEPFLLLPFIENSFKHCMNDEGESGWITIYISVKEDWLTLKVENSIPQKKAIADALEGQSGFGIVNVKKRLALLYPETHFLQVSEQEDSYFISLKIKLYAAA